MKSTLQLVQFAVAASAALVLSACGGGGSTPSGTSTAQGTLRLGLTDAPACGYDQVNASTRAQPRPTPIPAGPTSC
jgi:hypothetical protein